ncbi:MAG TPA: hypothetical protein VFV19_03220 [Candidatus Polarisedimenticolaceae bacterium]|nr:hypothetical protein [Candidatus Polarisedimenticolaceae bacterium]
MKLKALGAIATTLLLAAAARAAAPAADPDAGEDHKKAEIGEKEGPDLLFERSQWFAARRAGPDGFLRADGRNKAIAELKANIAKGLLRPGPLQRIAGDGWAPIGPAPELDGSYAFSGRVTAIAINPTNANIAYVGGAQGGVWKTTDHGATWTPMTDTQASLAIGSIAIAPSNGNVIYAGTGEGNQSCDSYFGAGILRSTDGGATWTLLGATPFANTSVTKILVHPGNPNILWAANGGGIGGFLCFAGPAGTYGVWRSTDAGATWLHVLGSTQIGSNAAIHDLAADPTNPNIIYAGANHSGVWKTTNGGTTWTKLAGGLPSSVGRVAVAVDPVTNTTVYATFENASNGRHLDTYKSTSSGTSWSVVTKPSGACQYWTFSDPCTYTGGTSGQCWYDLVLGVAPDHGVWLGGTGIWRSGDGGSTWGAVCPQSVHADQHAVAFKGSEVWLGNDGGVFTTTNNGGLWTSRNPGLQLAQFYPGGALDPQDGTRALAGAQDNGVQRFDGTASWSLEVTGDGGYAAIDSASPGSVWYGSTQHLNILKTQNGGASWFSGTNGLADANTNAAPFVAPYVMCPSNSQVLIAGSNNVWRTDDATANWTSNSPEFQSMVALAWADADAQCDTYYAVDSAGHILLTTDSGSDWRFANGNLNFSINVADIAVDPTSPATVVIATGGFSGPHLYRTTNALDTTPTWTAIDAGIPNVPMNAVLIDPDNPSVLYAGSDVGIFRSLDAGQSWEVFMGGHPNAAVFDLVAQSSTGTIVSFTHGRGAFKMGTFCNDQDACTTDRFDQVLGCTHTPLDCSDNDPCTTDSCSSATGCAHVPVVCAPVDGCHVNACDSGTGDCNATELPDGTGCDDQNACTSGDACAAGVCAGTPVTAPAEVDTGLRVDRNGTDALVSWNAALGATSSDLLRGDLASLPVGPGGDDELCSGAIAGTSATDSDVPLDGAGYWYLVRGANACAGAGTYGYSEINGVPDTERASSTCP